MPAGLVLFDSCAVVNFFASAYMGEVLQSIDGDAGIVDYVQHESQFIRHGHEGDGDGREQIVLDPFVHAGDLDVLTLETEEEFALFIDLALRLDDGEAATLAIAAIRSGMVITDDRKARTIAAEFSVPCFSSLGVIKTWVETTGLDIPTTRETLERIQFRARYAPGRNHQLYSWWRDILDSDDLL